MSAPSELMEEDGVVRSEDWVALLSWPGWNANKNVKMIVTPQVAKRNTKKCERNCACNRLP